MKKYFSSLSIVLIMSYCICFIGCANMKNYNTPYNTLSVSKSTYDNVLTICGDLYKRGIISDIQKKEIIRVSKQYKEYHNLSVKAYLVYQQTKDPKAQSEYLSNTILASEILAELIKYVQPYLEEK